MNEKVTPHAGPAGIVWPVVPALADSIVFALLFQFEQSQWWPEKRLAEYQFRQLEALIAHAVATTPYYRDALSGLVPAPGSLGPEAFRRFPFLTRSVLQERADALKSEALAKDHGKPHEVHSSGSTGRPVSVALSEINALINRALNMRYHLWHKRDFRGKVAAIVVMRSAELAQSAESEAPARWVFGFPSGPMLYCDILKPISEQIAWLQRIEPDYMLTYPTNLRALLEESARTGFKPQRLREAALMGEIVDPDIFELGRAVWGIDVSASYSAMEVGVMSMQCRECGTHHIQSESVLVEVVDDDGAQCAPGQVGHVVVTDLHNFAMPLIRYKIGDFAEVGFGCGCGRGLPTLTRIIGRARNMFTLPSGEKFWPYAFRVGELEKIAPIRQLQLVQRTTRRIDIKLVTDAPLSPDVEAQLRAYFAGVIRHRFDLNFLYVDEIPRTAGGKYEDYVSEVV